MAEVTQLKRYDARPINWGKWFLIGIGMLVSAFILLVPMIYIFVQAFSKGLMPVLQNLADPDMLHAIWLTVMIALMAVPVNLVFGILLAWLVALILHAAVGSATVAMMGATAIVAPMLPLYPGVSPEIIAIAIGSGAIGCTIVTDSLFWLVKQYCGATLNETFKYYTTATFIASVIALACTFLLSFII